MIDDKSINNPCTLFFAIVSFITRPKQLRRAGYTEIRATELVEVLQAEGRAVIRAGTPWRCEEVASILRFAGFRYCQRFFLHDDNFQAWDGNL